MITSEKVFLQKIRKSIPAKNRKYIGNKERQCEALALFVSVIAAMSVKPRRARTAEMKR